MYGATLSEIGPVKVELAGVAQSTWNLYIVSFVLSDQCSPRM